MLKIRSNFFNLGLASIVLFMSSCSIVNNEFSKRKYTKFKVRHEQNEIAKNTVNSVPTTASINEPSVLTMEEKTISVSMNTPAPELKKESKKNVSAIPSLKKESKELKNSNVSFTKSFIKTYSTLHKKAKHSNPNTNSVLLILLCLFLPFIAVLVERGVGTEFWITCLLCLFFWIPGVIYAFIVCFGGGGSGRSANR